MKRSLRYILFSFLFVLLFCFYGGTCNKSYAAEKKTSTVSTVQSVSNVEAGVKVSWKPGKKVDGYYIYRKGGKDKSFVKLTTIKSAKKSSYTDKRVKNGVRYTYKVCAYKKKKQDSNSVTKSVLYLSAPKIRSLTNNGKGSFRVRYTSNSKGAGYEICYADNSKFKKSKSIKVDSKKKLVKTVTGLKIDSVYYAKVRTYKKDGKKTVYSGWSKKAAILVTKAFTGYTTHVKTYLYDKIGSSKDPIMIWYMTKVRVLGTERHTSSGDWFRVKYKKKTYYAWQGKQGKNSNLFTSEKSSFKYKGDTYFEQAIIDKAFEYYNLPNEYGHKDSTGIPNKDGKYVFSCCGYVSCVLNEVMKTYVPTYQTYNCLRKLYEAGCLYNKGYDSQFDAKIICEGEPDYSKLRPGDVLFFKLHKEGDDRRFNHCAFYMGKGEMIQCTNVYGSICIAPLKDMYKHNFVGAVRFVPKSPDDITQLDKTMYTIQGKRSKVYSDMSASKVVLKKLTAGTKVTVLYTGNNNNWAYIRYKKNKYGFIKLKYLTKKKPVEQSSVKNLSLEETESEICELEDLNDCEAYSEIETEEETSTEFSESETYMEGAISYLRWLLLQISKIFTS